MQNEIVTFDKLTEAIGYLPEQVINLKRMVPKLQPLQRWLEKEFWISVFNTNFLTFNITVFFNLKFHSQKILREIVK